MPNALRLVFLMSLFSAAACAAAHALTFAGVAFYPILLLMPLLFIVWPVALWSSRKVPLRSLVHEIFGILPRGLKRGAVVVFVYIVANFIVSGWLNGFGHPTQEGDRLVLTQRGQVTRELTPAEFRRAQATEVRMLTGHLVGLFGLAALVLRASWIRASRATATR